MKTSPLAAQRGVGTIVMSLLLVFAILLSVAFANRSMLFEAKTSANQYRAAQAYEAAEAGLDWAIAQLNSDTPIGDDCLPSTDAAAIALRARTLDDVQAACMQSGAGWSCHCPASGSPRLAEVEGNTIGFSTRISAASQPDLLQLTSTGRSGSVAVNSTQVLVGRLPGLDSLPTAALTVRGAPIFALATFGLHHTDPTSGGLTLHSGGPVDSTPLQLAGPPGSPPAASVFAADRALAELSPDGLFASLFRMSKPAWREQPTVREVSCESACDTALAQATAGSASPQLIWLRGGLRLDTPITLGTATHPVLLVVDGPIEFHAKATVHGLIYGIASSWVDIAGASIDGAVVIEGDLQASGASQIHHDASALQALHDHTGTYARVPGSWRDF
ncbi:MAG: PilX N-terminal domain-containing pilus assembly protein [Rhizobacter sp.]